MRIVFGTVLSRSPMVAGSVLSRIRYVRGLAALGFEVLLLEDWRSSWSLDAGGHSSPHAASVSARIFSEVASRLEPEVLCAQLLDGTEISCARGDTAARDFIRSADVLINISGHVETEWVLEAIPTRVLVDTDPVYTQLWASQYGVDIGLQRHNVYFSRGLNLGTSACPIPTLDVDWWPVLPPIDVDNPVAAPPTGGGPFSTVMSWGRFKDVQHEGRWYRAKRVSLDEIASLPLRHPGPFVLSVQNPSWFREAVTELVDRGWVVRDGAAIGSLEAYGTFIGESRAELGVAKHAYRAARSGWFSERSAEYLASGRPVVAQSTGIEAHLDVGRGFLTFETEEELLERLSELEADYAGHASAARDFAAAYLDYRIVIPRMLDGLTGRSSTNAVGTLS